ncbi:MAG: polysaccharide pyruvyl transferase family protein, partial [Nanoarchaeota archaeon]
MSKIVTIGTTLSGNKGAASMLISLIKNFRQYDPLTEFVSLSYYPQSQEKRFNVYENLRIVPVTPKKLVFFLLPLSLIFFLFSWIAPVKKLCLRYRPLREIHEADLFVDISGISFSDGRGLIIIFNILCVLIPLCMRKRIIKYSQALGPFETKMNRFFAKLLLPRVDTIIARGDATKENLDALGLEKTHTKADGALSFPLSPSLISSRMRKLLETLAAKQKAKERLVVGISPSSVVYKYCERNGIDYAGILRRLTKTLLNREDILVVLFPYSARQGKEKMKNNDIPIVKMVARGFSSSNRLAVIRNEYSAED